MNDMMKCNAVLLDTKDIEEIRNGNVLVDSDTMTCEVLDVAFSYGEHRTTPIE